MPVDQVQAQAQVMQQEQLRRHLEQQAQQGRPASSQLPGSQLIPQFLSKMGFDQTRRSGVSHLFSGLSGLYRSLGQPYGWGFQALDGLFRLLSGLFMFVYGKGVYAFLGLQTPEMNSKNPNNASQSSPAAPQQNGNGQPDHLLQAIQQVGSPSFTPLLAASQTQGVPVPQRSASVSSSPTVSRKSSP